MAVFIPAKTASEVVQRRWTVPVDVDDGIASVAMSGSGVTVDSSEIEGDDVVLVLSAGTAGATGSITVTVTTDQARTLIETIYIPIVQSAAQIAATARDFATFALRKVFGARTPTARASDDAMERLSGLIAAWRAGGADIGAPFPLTLNSVIYCPDWAVEALRYNLLIECAPLYGYEPSSTEGRKALRGLQLVKHKGLPVVREGAEYY